MRGFPFAFAWIIAGLLAAGSAVTASAEVPTPKVTLVPGEAPGSADHNYPFFSTDIVLKNFGYVEEEFFFEGTANTYTTTDLNRNADVSGSGFPYKSRLLVRRPATAARFNGVVIVEWFNVTNQYDTDVLWLYQKEFFIREGYAWVGVSAQNGGISNAQTGLKVWSPKRYGSLDVTAGGKVPGDGLSYDIFSQAAAAIRRVPAVMGGLRPTLVIAAGQSQSAGRMGPYLNGVHARDAIYDAALLTVNNQPIRSDLAIPVIKVLSETERNDSRSQPDLDRVRVWTVTGATHSEQYSLLSRAAFLLRDLKRQAVDACETPARSRVEIRYVYNAAIDALVKWKKNGTAPPHGPALVFDEGALNATQAAGRGGGRGPAQEVIKRDSDRNALGGIRLPEIEVPVANESAINCGLGGTHVPFQASRINELYPTHENYVSKVTATAEGLVKAGFMLPAEARQSIEKAKRSIWGLQLTCGPLCADVRQFPSNPSSQLLANQTAFLLIKDGDSLVKVMDDVTRSLAEAYTLASVTKGKEKFAAAAAGIQKYIEKTRALAARGNMPKETEALLVDQATTLLNLVKKQASAAPQ